MSYSKVKFCMLHIDPFWFCTREKVFTRKNRNPVSVFVVVWCFIFKQLTTEISLRWHKFSLRFKFSIRYYWMLNRQISSERKQMATHILNDIFFENIICMIKYYYLLIFLSITICVEITLCYTWKKVSLGWKFTSYVLEKRTEVSDGGR